MVTIARFMTRDLVTVDAEAPARRLARTFATHSLRHLLVLDEEGHLVGIVDDATVFKFGLFTSERGWEPFAPDDREPTARELANPALIARVTELVRPVPA